MRPVMYLLQHKITNFYFLALLHVALPSLAEAETQFRFSEFKFDSSCEDHQSLSISKVKLKAGYYHQTLRYPGGIASVKTKIDLDKVSTSITGPYINRTTTRIISGSTSKNAKIAVKISHHGGVCSYYYKLENAMIEKKINDDLVTLGDEN